MNEIDPENRSPELRGSRSELGPGTVAPPQPPLAVEMAAEADIEPLLELRDEAARWLVERGVDQWQVGEFPRRLLEQRIAQRQVWLVRGPGGITGTVNVLWKDTFVWGEDDGRDGRAGYIHFLVTDRAAAPSGLGRQLLVWAERHIAAQGRRVARLDCVTSNVRLRAYYEAAAYRPVGSKESIGASALSPRTWHPTTLFEKPLPAHTVSAPVSATGALSTEHTRLVAGAQAFAEASLADSTRRAYRSDLADFSLWCHQHPPSRPLPTTPETICLYLTDLAQQGRAVSTLQRRLAALKLAHRTAGHEHPGGPASPTEDVTVRQVMRGIRRTVGIAPRRQAAPLVIQQLRVLLAANLDESVRDVQDYALLLLGFAFAGRASDLVSLDVSDLEFTDRGLLIHLRRSKTDQEKAGEVVAVPSGQHQETDPILAVRRWLTLSELTAGPVWRGVDRWGNLSSERLSTRGVTRAIQRAVATTEMDGTGLSSHSLRAGFATSAAAAGASERSIAAQTRHRSMTTLRRYIRLATAFDENAVSKVGL